MVFSLLYMVVRWLIGLVVVLSRGDLSKEVELLVLRHENAVLRRQVAGGVRILKIRRRPRGRPGSASAWSERSAESCSTRP